MIDFTFRIFFLAPSLSFCLSLFFHSTFRYNYTLSSRRRFVYLGARLFPQTVGDLLSGGRRLRVLHFRFSRAPLPGSLRFPRPRSPVVAHPHRRRSLLLARGLFSRVQVCAWAGSDSGFPGPSTTYQCGPLTNLSPSFDGPLTYVPKTPSTTYQCGPLTNLFPLILRAFNLPPAPLRVIASNCCG